MKGFYCLLLIKVSEAGHGKDSDCGEGQQVEKGVVRRGWSQRNCCFIITLLAPWLVSWACCWVAAANFLLYLTERESEGTHFLRRNGCQ